jgi:effector-binding domain-containing protein
MDENMGPDFKRGLESLKKVAEERAASSPSLPVSEVEVEALPIYYIEGESKISEMSSDFFGSRYGALMAYLGSDAQNMLEMPMAIAQEWNEEDDYAKIWVALACESDKGEVGEIKKGMTHAGKAVMCEYRGDYAGTEAGHIAASEYIEANNLQMAGAPWEVYVTDPMMEPDTTKWLTKVYYPIADASSM